MADDLGYEGLGCNGGTSYATPVFDRLARQGMRFTNCYCQPVCTPSRNKIMTGRSNARNYRSFGHMDPNEITFGSLMKDAGYRTAIAGKWRLFDVPSDFEEEHPLDRGTATSDVIFARDKLKSTLDSMPPWQPDNSIFKGGPDQQTRQRRQRMAALTE